MTTAAVDSIAQGRVWTGIDAKEIGLVDVIGSLDSAISIAAKMAKLEDYKLVSYPEDNDPFSKFFKNFSSESSGAMIRKYTGDDFYKYLEHVRMVKNMKGMQTRMPFTIEIE